MAFYKSPADMYSARADRFKRDGDRHWAMAKQGQGDFHYGKAKTCYARADENIVRASKSSTAPWPSRKK